MIGYQEPAYGSDVVNGNDGLTDLERDLARLLDNEPAFGINERESEIMNEMNEEPGQRGVSYIDSAPPPPPKVDISLDEPSMSDFDSEYRRLEKELNEDASPFERNYMPNDLMANEFNERELDDFENENYARGLNEDMDMNSFSDLNRRFRADDADIISDFEDSDYFASDYKQARDIDENAWAADLDDGSPNFENRFMPEEINGRVLHDEFDNNADFSEDILSPEDANGAEMRDLDQQGYERFLNTMFGRSGGDIEDGTEVDGEDTEDVDDEPGDRGLDDELNDMGLDDGPDDRGLDDGEREILRRLMDTILKKRNDKEAELDEPDLEDNVDRF